MSLAKPIAGLDTGMRQGEMLALRFKDIDFVRGLITLRGETTKSRKTRLVPIPTARLRAVLEWLQLEADGTKKPDDALVFSDETGEPLGRFRTAWVTTVLKAHGIAPEWKAYGWTALTPACLEEFRRLTCAGTTCVTSTRPGWSRKTSRWPKCATCSAARPSPRPSAYDNQKLENLQAAAARLERGETFDPGPREPGSPSICQAFVKNSADQAQEKDADRVRGTTTNANDDEDLESWLGVRDGIRNWLITVA